MSLGALIDSLGSNTKRSWSPNIELPGEKGGKYLGDVKEADRGEKDG